jgi:putative ABC transport system permease protein
MSANIPYQVGDNEFFGIQTCAVDTNFLRMFHFDYIHGSPAALDEPDRILITESVAMRLFGDTDVVGKTIELGKYTVQVNAVVRDLPLNTHFIFSGYVSWKTILKNEEWDDFNAYTYIKTMPGVQLTDIDTAIASTVRDYISLVSEEYGMKYQPILHRVDEIHLSGYLDEDFAPKRSKNYVYIILSVIVLFLLTGVFNYLNLALAELTTQVKKIAILRTFGGINADHKKVAITDAILCLFIVAPVVALIMTLVLQYPGSLPPIEPRIWSSPLFVGLAAGLVFLILICSSLNSVLISKNELLLAPLKGNSSGSQKGFAARKILVAAQLSFSIIMIGLITVIVDQFQFVNNNDKGFDDHDVIVIDRRGGDKETMAFEEKVRGMSGVKIVASASFYAGARMEKKDIFELETATGMKKILVNFIHCESDFPALLNLRIKEGRGFDEEHASDRNGKAYLINETLAKEFGWDKPSGK